MLTVCLNRVCLFFITGEGTEWIIYMYKDKFPYLLAIISAGSVVNIVLTMTRSCNVNGYNSSSDAEYVFNSLDTAVSIVSRTI